MAVCNLFNPLSSASGNFMLFSQYVEDVTHNYAEGDNWKVVPTGFVALNVDYSKIDKSLVLNSYDIDMNNGIPKYFQNCFENACAYGRAHYSEWTQSNEGVVKPWTSEISRNLFWNCMYDGGFITTKQYGSETSTVKYIPEVVYYGNISMHSYNEHKGMGYNEIYCYIPTDAPKMNCQVVCITDSDINGRLCDTSNNSIYLEGHKDKLVEDYPQNYFYNRDFSMVFDDSSIGKLNSSNESQYGINTIVVQYSVFRKLNDNCELIHNNIPMGMYITGRFDDNDNLTNPITKYVTTSYGSGTSYGLRICTRFSANPSGLIMTNSDMTVDDSGYTNICQLMTAMNENLSRMLDISKSAIDTTQSYKDLLSIFKNNRTNVPYIKDVNGVDCWFVNGRYIGSVVAPENLGCSQLDASTIEKRFNNLEDNDPTNDWTYIEDTNGVDCLVISNNELAEELGLNPDDYPEYGGGSTGGDGVASSGDPSDYIIADAEDVISKLNN